METVRLGRDAIALLITICIGYGILQVSTSLDSYSISINYTDFVVCSSLDNRTIAIIMVLLTKRMDVQYVGVKLEERKKVYLI